MLARQLPRTFTAVNVARSITTLNNNSSFNQHKSIQQYKQPHTQLQQLRYASSIPSVNIDSLAAADAAKQIIDKVASMYIYTCKSNKIYTFTIYTNNIMA